MREMCNLKYRAIAHRGYPAKYPENTMIGFQAAVDLSFTHLEVDVHLTKDGVPVIMHDPTLDRTTNGKGPILQYTWEELKEVTVGRDQKIPTLAEMLKFTKYRIFVDIEIKQEGDKYKGIEHIVLEEIRKHGMFDQVFLSSFDHYCIQRLRKDSDKVQLCLVYYGQSPSAIPYAKQINANYVAVRHNFITKEYINLCLENDIQIVAWTIDDPAIMKKFSAESNVLVITNDLEKWIEVQKNN